MGLGSFLQSASRLIRTLTRPDWKTYWLSIKIVFVGVAIIGAIGYFVKAIALMFTPSF